MNSEVQYKTSKLKSRTHYSELLHLTLENSDQGNKYERLNKQLEYINSIMQDIDEALDVKRGKAFYDTLVCCLSAVLNADYVFIGKISDGSVCHTTSLCVDGQLAEPITYDLTGTPCRDVNNRNACTYGKNVQQLFPEDLLLQEMGVQAYAGVSIDISASIPDCYILVSLYRHEIEHVEFHKHILTLIASKIRSEIEVQQLNNNLIESEKRYRNFANLTSEGVIILKNGIIIDANEKCRTLFGYSFDELIGQDVQKLLVHPDDVELVENQLARDPNQVYLVRFLTKEGETLEIEVEGESIFYKNQACRVVMLRNQTEQNRLLNNYASQNEKYLELNDQLQKKNNELLAVIRNYNKLNTELKESEQRFRELFDSANDAIIIFDVESKQVIQTNKKTEDLLGYSIEELGQKSIMDLYPKNPEAKKNALKHMKLLLGKGQHRIEDEFTAKSGRTINVEISSRFIEIDNKRYIQSIIRDITERVLRDNQIRYANDRLLHTIEMSKRAEIAGKVTFFEYDFNNKETWISNNFYEMFGYQRGLVATDSPETLFNLVHTEDADKALNEFESLEDQEDYEIAARIRMADDQYCHVKVNGKVLKDGGGFPVKLSAIIQNVDENVKQENKFKQVFESILDVYFETDSNDVLTVISPSVKSIFGYEKENLLHTSIGSLYVNPTDLEILHHKIEKYGKVTNHRVPMYDIAKEVIYVELNAKLKTDEFGMPDGMVGVARNVTERVEKERQLELYTHRLEAAERAGKIGIWDWDLVNDKLWWSAERYRMLGEEPFSFEPTNERFGEYLIPEDFKKLGLLAERAIQGSGEVNTTVRLKDKHGNRKVCLTQGRVERDQSGNAIRWYGVDVDITEILQKQEQLDEKQRLERTMLDTVSEGVVIYNKEYIPITFNKKAIQILGVYEEEFSTHSIFDTDWRIYNERGEKISYHDYPVVKSISTGASVQNKIIGIQVPNADMKWLSITSNRIGLSNKEGITEDHALVSFTDYTDAINKRKTEEIVAASFEAMNEGIVIQDDQAKIIGMNDAACEVLGLSKAQMEGLDSFDPRWRAIKEDGSDFPGHEHPAVITLETGEPMHDVIMGVHKPTGDLSWISINTSPIYYQYTSSEFSPDGVVATFNDITETFYSNERQRLTTAISERLVLDDNLESNSKFILQLLSEYAGAPYAEYWSLNRDNTVGCNARYYMDRWFKPLKMLSKDLKLSISSAHLSPFFKSQKVGTFNYINRVENNQLKELFDKLGVVQITGVPVGIKDDIKGVILLFETKINDLPKEDVALYKNIGTLVYQYLARYESHIKLLESLKEKEFLFKEVHHRVKNNLQLIISTLYLRFYNHDDDRFKNKIEDLINSVKSIAIIHEQLMQSKKVNTIEISTYISRLASEIPMSLGADTSRLCTEIDFVRKVVNMDFAVNFGLLINELMANSIKHAFKEEIDGTIRISLKRIKNKTYELTYQDNGVGIDDQYLSLTSSESLGLNLIHSFSSQIKADVDIDNKNGTKYTFTFNMN